MSNYLFGVDLGGTTVKMGLFDIKGEVIEKWEIPTRKEEAGSKILPDIADAINIKIAERGIEKSDVKGIGIGLPGPIEKESIVHKAVNLGWTEDVYVKKIMEELTGIPTKAENDANVAALGEMWKGGGQGFDSIVMVTLGTGVGGGIIIDGKVLSGSTGAGGEIGHIHMKDDEEVACGCGNYGCFEQYASATGLVRTAKKILSENTDATILDAQTVSAKDVFDAVKTGDKVAIKIAEQYGKDLGKGMAVIGSILNPQAYVLGGGVSKAGDILLTFVKDAYLKDVFHGSRDAKILLATLGNDAGIYGAAKLVL